MYIVFLNHCSFVEVTYIIAITTMITVMICQIGVNTKELCVLNNWFNI